jgi:hypothetical protein
MMSGRFKELKSTIYCLLLALCAVFFTGYWAAQTIHDAFLSETHKPQCESNLSFINPEPGCELYEEKLEQMKRLERLLQEQVDKNVHEGLATRIAVFKRFEYKKIRGCE